MDINITLWIIGILFTLSILAIKLGFGLGFSGLRWQGICAIFFSYLVLFVLMAMFSSQLIKFLEPVLRKGPYLHAGMAMGMIVWGMFVISRQSAVGSWQSEGGKQKTEGNFHALWLIVPCPVCLTAITFCTWAALGVIKLPSSVVGLGLGCSFVLLSLLFLTLARLKKSTNPRISLGLCMITIGCYFLASLILPAKIEAAKGMYQSFLAQGNSLDVSSSYGVIALLFAAGIIGYLARKFLADFADNADKNIIREKISAKSAVSARNILEVKG